MNYRGKKVAITGHRGFIGNEIMRSLTPRVSDKFTHDPNLPAQVVVLDGDIRNPETFAELDHTFDYLFHFAAPSSQVQFKRDPAYCVDTTMRGFMNVAEACKRYGIRLIYPSTGLLSQNRYNEYAMCKKLCEDYVRGAGMNALGVRIFATYGPGEGHKADYASVPYLFARDMINGRAPVVYGNGEQRRDFIYIEDTVGAILQLAEECFDPIVDVGSGVSVTFNAIIERIQELYPNAPQPTYVKAPSNYVEETAANIETMMKYYKRRVTIADGIKLMCDSIERLKK